VSPPILDLRRYTPKVLRLTNISVEQNDNVEARLRNDDKEHTIPTAGLPDQKADKWSLIALETLRYNLYASAGVSNFRTRYSLWVIRPTVAHKIALGKPLSVDEERINKELNVQESVYKGILPLSIPYMIDREYRVIDEVSYTWKTNIVAGETVSTKISAKKGEFLVLTKIASAPALVADNVVIKIDRDIDTNYIELNAYAMSLAEDGGVICFIPALSGFNIKLTASQNVSNHAIRYTIRSCQMTDLLRARFGLPARSGVPASLFDKVKGGIL